MLNIEILLRSRLVKDALLLVLLTAGFSVLAGFTPMKRANRDDNILIVVTDFDDWHVSEAVHAHQSHGAKIVALASENDVLDVDDARIAPLSGILTYDLSADAFAQSLRLIASGERVLPRNLALGKKATEPSPGSEPRPGGDRLTAREKEILSDLVKGHSNKMIAWHLGIAEATVKVHLKSVLRKIRVENRTQAAVWTLANLPELSAVPRGSV
jgi:DNA-binding NarL/FixJ family response regulator